MADESITLADVIEHRRLGPAKLVVLSACETGLPAFELLDEAVAFPTAWIEAGASAVMASLWFADDLATMVLMSKFYELWRGRGVGLAEALRQAQRWVRELDRGDRAESFPGVDFSSSGDPGDRPYENPHWWAAFELTVG